MSDEERDRLIEALLPEALGGSPPPDLTQRVLRRAFPARETRWGRLAALAVAAGFLAAVGLALWPSDGMKNPPAPGRSTAAAKSGSETPAPGYPTPVAEGDFRVVEGSAVGRGAVIEAGAGGARLRLGGYAKVSLAPQTRTRIEGGERTERIFLAAGAAECSVNRHVGEFAVATEAGTVSVTGTEFTVRVIPGQGGTAMTGKRIAVKVLAGAVLVAGAWGRCELAAGQDRLLPDGGTITGIVVNKGPDGGWIAIRGEDAREPIRYVPRWIGGAPSAGGGLDRDMMRAIRETPAGSKVRAEWRFEEHFRVLRLEILERGQDEPRDRPVAKDEPVRKDPPRDRPKFEEPDVKSGTLQGLVLEKGSNWIRVQADGEDGSKRYIPRWIGGMPKDGGGPDREGLAEIAKAQQGDRIALKWMWEEHYRVLRIEVIERGHRPPHDPPAGKKDEPARKDPPRDRPGGKDDPARRDPPKYHEPDVKAGVLKGVVLEKGPDWVRVRADGRDRSERYMPRWIGGAPAAGGHLDQEALAQIAQVQPGDRVALKWVWEERYRVVRMEVISRGEPQVEKRQF